MLTKAQKINDIIDRRRGLNAYVGNGHLQVVLKKMEFLNEVKNLLGFYANFRNKVVLQIENQKGDYYNMSLEDPIFEQRLLGATPNSTIEKIDKTLKKLEELKIRFSRDSINISVIGRAGQGKSRLLQSISGLDNAIIPADSGGDCTGAKSVICNSSEPLHAIIHCYNETELIEQVQKYLDALNYKGKLGSISQIKDIAIDIIRQKQLTNKQESYLERLISYVNYYADYSHLIGSDFSVNNKDDIRQYVAQYLLNGTKTYKFLAVKEVQIFTPFEYDDAGKIMLIDTIGLGDTSIGLRERVIDTLINDSDAAILLRRPDKERDGIREEDNDLYDMINERMNGCNLEKWLFYVLNIYSDNEKTGENLYNQLIRKLGKTLNAAFIEKIDCADIKAVEDKLIIPMLDSLSANLTDIDNSLMHSANELLTECYNEYFNLCNKIQTIADSNFKKDLSTGGLFDTLYDEELNLARKLEEINLQFKDHTIKCDEIENEIKKNITHIIQICPTFDEILYNLKSGRLGAHPSIVYENMSDHYRAGISDIFDEINNETIINLQERFKHQIIRIFRDEDGGKLNVIPLNTNTENLDDIEWLETFVSQKLNNYPLVKDAFENILTYRINIEGMLEYYVNTSLEFMDPEEKRKFAKVDFSEVETKEEEAELIEQGLLSASKIALNKLITQIQDLLQIPYNSFYARVRKLREQIIYSKNGGRELKNMYREFAPYIWKEQFASMATKQVAMKELNDIISSFSEKRKKQLFVIKFDNI